MKDASVIQVFVFRDGNYVGNEVFTEPEIVIGHGEGVDLSLEDERVSYNHALLSHENGQATLLKLGAGSVMINRTEVEHSYVTPRDEIQIGAHVLKIKFLTPKATQPSPSQQPSQQPSQAPSRAPSPWDPNPSSRPIRRVDPAISAPVSEAFADELTAEQLTERIDAKSAQPIDGARRSEQSSVSLFEEKTNVPVGQDAPRGGRGRGRFEPVFPHEDSEPSTPFNRPGQPNTGSIEITGSQVVAVRQVGAAADSGRINVPHEVARRLPEPGMSQGGLDNVWDDSANPDGVDLETLHADHLEMALDAAFTGMSEPPQPKAKAPLATDLKIPKPRLPQAQAQSQPAWPGRPDVPEARMAGRDLPAASAPLDPYAVAPTLPSISQLGEKAVSETDFRADREDKTAPRPYQPVPAQPLARILPQVAQAAQALYGTGDLDDDMDDYEIDERIRPNYSLIDTILRPGGANVAVLDRRQALEIIAFTKDGVRASALLKTKGDKYVLGKAKPGRMAPPAGHPGLKLAKILSEGAAEIEFPSDAEGFIQGPDRRVALDELKLPQNAVSKRGNVYRSQLPAGSIANINLEEMSFHLRFVRPPAVPKDRRGFEIDRHITRSLASSLGVHIVVAFLIGILAPGVSYSEAAREVWSDPARDQIRDVELKQEPPPPEPTPPEPVKEEKAPEPEKPEKPEPPPKTVKKERRRSARSAPVQQVAEAPPPKEIKTVGVLGAMGKLNLAAPGKKSMVQAVSNIDAVRAPGGSNFRLANLLGKIPTSAVSVGGGGGGLPLTRGGAELLRGGTGIGKLDKTETGKVRGSVTHASARQVEAKGSISREEVAAVINAHLREVQYCYEKTLLKDPGLTGKLILEWTIDQNGGVGRVKEKLSTLRNPAVSSCISGSLKRWVFPKPRGGIVIVSYPFIFNAVGF